MDAKTIENIFNKEIDTLYLNFSDPWPKKKHTERRLTSQTFLKKYDSIFIGQEKIIMKTDNKGLFGYSLQSFNEYNYLIKEITLDLYNSDFLEDNVATEYESKFHNLGTTINRVVVEKEKKAK